VRSTAAPCEVTIPLACVQVIDKVVPDWAWAPVAMPAMAIAISVNFMASCLPESSWYDSGAALDRQGHVADSLGRQPRCRSRLTAPDRLPGSCPTEHGRFASTDGRESQKVQWLPHSVKLSVRGRDILPWQVISDPSATRGDFMRNIVSALVASVLLTGCVSGSGSESHSPNYVTSQASQAPAIRNDTFGGAAMPMRGLPR
jgi:hypothetical protein